MLVVLPTKVWYIDGQFKWIPSSALNWPSFQFQPSKNITDDDPEIIPPLWLWVISTPLIPTVFKILESVLYAIKERTFGLNLPTSSKSFVA